MANVKGVYLLYEGNEHLSVNSLVLMGVFTSEKELEKAVKSLIKERISDNFDPWSYDYPITEAQFVKEEVTDFVDNMQTFNGTVRFKAEWVELNKLEEI